MNNKKNSRTKNSFNQGGVVLQAYFDHYKPRLVFFLPNFHFRCGLYCRASIISWFFFCKSKCRICSWPLLKLRYLWLHRTLLVCRRSWLHTVSPGQRNLIKTFQNNHSRPVEYRLILKSFNPIPLTWWNSM